MSKRTLRTAAAAVFGILIAVGGCTRSPTAPEATKAAKPASSQPNLTAYTVSGS